ncbi:MAG: PilZ domain-containing protein [Candidatus Omnitrophica bacterium]|nr:PilZ domain-containing protein [Candidatus Omnitrophota bacterium]
MSPWDGLNRRKFPRVSCPCMVTLRNSEQGQETFLTHTENVGVGGVGVVIKKQLKLFSPVTLELDPLDLGNNIKCHGKVVWVVRRRNEDPHKPMFYDIGIEFADMGEEDRERLSNIIERLRKARSI